MANGDPQISIPVGITVGLLASFIQSLGLTIQRKSHVINQALPEAERRVEHRRPLWLLGFGIFISSNLFGSVFQIASLPVVILAPLGAVSLLWNAFFARILLGDVFSVWMLLGTLLVAGGAVLIAIFGIVPEPTHSLEDLLLLFNRPVFVVYFSLLGAFTIACLVITHLTEYSYARRVALPDVSPPLSPLIVPTSHPSILTTATTASTAADPTERTPLIDRKYHPRDHGRSKSPSPSGTAYNQSILSSAIEFNTKSDRTPLFLAASYASFSGIISGMCLLFAKSGVELLILTVAGDNQFWRWQAWVLLLSLGVCALLQLWYMHKSLVLADPTVVCPLAFCFYNLSSIINGLVYFDQFSLLSTTQLLLVLLGITILLAGLWIVSFPPTGGHSIDIGAWTHDQQDTHSIVSGELYDSASDGEEEEIHDDEPLPMQARRRSRTMPAPSRPQSEEIGLNSVTPDQHHVINQPPEPVIPPSLTTATNATFPPRPSRLRASSSLRPASDSIRHSRSSYATESIQPPSSTSRRRTTLAATSVGQPQYPSTLLPNGPTLPGFSIGLSPVSPGFALVPTERRRRAPGVGRRESAVDEHGSRNGIRRVVSENDRAGYAHDDRGREVHRSGEVHSPGEIRDALLPGPGQSRRAKGRWKWLRSVFATTSR